MRVIRSRHETSVMIRGCEAVPEEGGRGRSGLKKRVEGRKGMKGRVEGRKGGRVQGDGRRRVPRVTPSTLPPLHPCTLGQEE